MATATAAPRPPHPTSDSSGDEPSRWQGLKWFMYESLVGSALDPHDPKYKPKVGWQGFVQFVLKKMGGDSVSLSVSDTPKLLGGVLEYHHRSQGTVTGLRKQLIKAAGEIHDLNRKAEQARTSAEREEIAKDLESARKAYKYKTSSTSRPKKPSRTRKAPRRRSKASTGRSATSRTRSAAWRRRRRRPVRAAGRRCGS
ncbi:hypothetical protein [Streptomyces melanogenes]|uniref:hypothetical protein n=1 Tax=Streptomyces melanogenes TaxID=67326 RepID=UPI0037AD6664